MAKDNRSAMTPEQYEEEIARLRQENEILRKNRQGPQLDGTVGNKARYRVRLKAIERRDGTIQYVPIFPKAQVVVHPYVPLPGMPGIPEHLRAMPSESFSNLELKISGKSPWELYKAKHPNINDADRPFFRFTTERGDRSEWLDVEAVSPADAWEIYRRYCGITATIHQPEVEKVAA